MSQDFKRVDFECDLDSLIDEAIRNGAARDDIKYVLQMAVVNFDHNWPEPPTAVLK